METNESASQLNLSNLSSREMGIRLPSLPHVHLVVLVCLFSLTAILSLVGNTTVVTVLMVRKRLSRSVRLPLVNLALADILVTVFCIFFTLSQVVYHEWLFPSFLCPIVFCMQEMVLVVSVLTLTLIGIDRYLAILFPLKFRWIRTSKFVILSLIAIWIVAFATTSVILAFTRVTSSWRSDDEPVAYHCSLEWPSMEWYIGYSLTRFITIFIIPFIILTFTYSSIAWKLFHRTPPGNADVERDNRQRESNIKVVKMLILIVVLFVICWVPMQLVIILHMMELLEKYDINTMILIFLWVYWLAMSNCFVNPFIYCFTNNNVIEDVKFISVKLKNNFRNTCNLKKSSKPNRESAVTKSLHLSSKKPLLEKALDTEL